MLTSNKTEYDAIIIGAGISGLVCGCYLAKAGLKTLIVEKNTKPGGYCTSFTRKGLLFDACVYSLSSFRKGGSLNRIMQDFELQNEIKLIRHDIPDIVITPNKKISFYTDIKKTILEFQKSFPHQNQDIERFFKFLHNSPVISLLKLRTLSLEKLLDTYFTDPELKTVLSIILLGYTGLPASRLSAFIACMIYREFVFDGGYYPVGGMQKLPDALTRKILFYGGELVFSTNIREIRVENNSVKGVTLQNKEFIPAKAIIAACDAQQVFSKLINKNSTSDLFLNKFSLKENSLSAFLVYLGINKDLSLYPDLKSHNWIITRNYDSIEKIYTNLIKGNYDYTALTSSSLKTKEFLGEKFEKETLCLFMNMPYKNELFWNDANRQKIKEIMISIARKIIPDLKNHIELEFTATPNTLQKLTSNHNGAAYGWADTTEQFADPDLSEKTTIGNLFLTGHWTNKSSGIASVVNSGYRTAETITSKLNKILYLLK